MKPFIKIQFSMVLEVVKLSPKPLICTPMPLNILSLAVMDY